jgi:hypothetical protein
MNPLLKETFVFRPNCEKVTGEITITHTQRDYNHNNQPMLRYAKSKWIPDDGEYDLAFIQGVFAYGINLPHNSNLLYSWRDIVTTRKWLEPCKLEKFTTSWHYQTIDNKELVYWESKDRDNHPNEIASRSAMNKCSSINSVANGRCIDLMSKTDLPHRQGDIYIQRTMQPVSAPENPTCYLCLDNGKGHILEALAQYKDNLESDIADYQREKDRAELKIYDCEKDIAYAQSELENIEYQLKELGDN